MSVFLSLCCPESESQVKGGLKEVKPNWIDLHQKRQRVSTGKERGKKQERQEQGQCESEDFRELEVGRYSRQEVSWQV